MQKTLSILPRWIPASFMMLAIFLFSSLRSPEIPFFIDWDYFVKKASHVIGYALLGLSYLYLLSDHKNRYVLAWGMALVYALTDEFHQSFVPGRSASLFDVLIFDNIGAIIALSLHHIYLGKDESHTT